MKKPRKPKPHGHKPTGKPRSDKPRGAKPSQRAYSKPSGKPSSKKKGLAAMLRDNLFKRKDQARSRAKKKSFFSFGDDE